MTVDASHVTFHVADAGITSGFCLGAEIVGEMTLLTTANLSELPTGTVAAKVPSLLFNEIDPEGLVMTI